LLISAKCENRNIDLIHVFIVEGIQGDQINEKWCRPRKKFRRKAISGDKPKSPRHAKRPATAQSDRPFRKKNYFLSMAKKSRNNRRKAAGKFTNPTPLCNPAKYDYIYDRKTGLITDKGQGRVGRVFDYLELNEYLEV